MEATRQVDERYLYRRQEVLCEAICPEEYHRELQRTRAEIVSHNVYGVSLNATAVELAEIPLWLDTILSGLVAPWFTFAARQFTYQCLPCGVFNGTAKREGLAPLRRETSRLPA